MEGSAGAGIGAVLDPMVSRGPQEMGQQALWTPSVKAHGQKDAWEQNPEALVGPKELEN